MAVFGFDFKLPAFWGKSEKDFITQARPQPRAWAGSERHILTVGFDGEKNQGEAGPIKNYVMMYRLLRARSWKAFADSDIAQTVIKKYIKWIIGSGLELQSEPIVEYLKMRGINIDTEAFNESIEASFTIFNKSKRSSYSGMNSLKQMAAEAFKNAIVGGDVLIIQRYVKKKLTVQLVDGDHVDTPYFQSNFIAEATARGNRIQDGVEIDATGAHVAYYVKKTAFEFERVLAKNSTGMTMAFLVYGMKYRLNDVRGIPLLGVVLESINTLDRYKSATVGSAEERQKMPFAIEHSRDSTGENPLLSRFVKASNVIPGQDDTPVTIDGVQLERAVAASINKSVTNLPIGATLKSLDSKNELYFKDFFTVNINLVCSALCIPPEVALSKYDSNFSASRAALKDWEHTIIIDRAGFSEDFYNIIYQTWLDIKVYQGEVIIPGYLSAKLNQDYDILEAFQNCNFVGPTVPHIDPLKEVAAERLKLGDTGAGIPLTSVQNAVRNLNAGDSDGNMMQYAEELKAAKKLGIISEIKQDPKL